MVAEYDDYQMLDDKPPMEPPPRKVKFPDGAMQYDMDELLGGAIIGIIAFLGAKVCLKGFVETLEKEIREGKFPMA